MKMLTTLVIPAFATIVVTVSSASASLYSDAVLADNPVGYWRFEDASSANGMTAANSSASGATQDGTYNGNITQISGATPNLGGAASFDGTADFINVAMGSPFQFPVAAAFSVEAWTKKPDQYTSSFERIVDNGFSVGGWTLVTNAQDGDPALFRRFAATVVSSVGYDDDEWHHVVATFDGTNSRIYVDGALAGTAGGGNSGGGQPTLRIGANHSGTEAYLGGLDEVAIYSSALSLDEIQAHYAAAFAVAPTAPEPSSLLLAATGLLGLVTYRRRRRR